MPQNIFLWQLQMDEVPSIHCGCETLFMKCLHNPTGFGSSLGHIWPTNKTISSDLHLINNPMETHNYPNMQYN